MATARAAPDGDPRWERLWRRARAFSERPPGIDPSDVGQADARLAFEVRPEPTPPGPPTGYWHGLGPAMQAAGTLRPGPVERLVEALRRVDAVLYPRSVLSPEGEALGDLVSQLVMGPTPRSRAFTPPPGRYGAEGR